jgi:hypothetical protein
MVGTNYFLFDYIAVYTRPRANDQIVNYFDYFSINSYCPYNSVLKAAYFLGNEEFRDSLT